jgi:hypothetical protein
VLSSPLLIDPQNFLPALKRFLLPYPKHLLVLHRLFPAKHESNHSSYFHVCSKYLQFVPLPSIIEEFAVWVCPFGTSVDASILSLGTESVPPLPHKSNVRASYTDLRKLSWQDISDCTFLSRESLIVPSGLYESAFGFNWLRRRLYGGATRDSGPVEFPLYCMFWL